jgi:hypothetical protein
MTSTTDPIDHPEKPSPYPPVEVKITTGPTAEEDAAAFPAMYEQIRQEREGGATRGRGWDKPAEGSVLAEVKGVPAERVRLADPLEVRLLRYAVEALPVDMRPGVQRGSTLLAVMEAVTRSMAVGLRAVADAAGLFAIEPTANLHAELDAISAKWFAHAASRTAPIPQVLTPNGGPEPIDNVFINIQVPLAQRAVGETLLETTSTEIRSYFERLFAVADGARMSATREPLDLEDFPRVVLMLPHEVYQLGMQTTGRTGDTPDREVPLLHLLAAAFPLVEAVEARDPDRTTLNQRHTIWLRTIMDVPEAEPTSPTELVSRAACAVEDGAVAKLRIKAIESAIDKCIEAMTTGEPYQRDTIAEVLTLLRGVR